MVTPSPYVSPAADGYVQSQNATYGTARTGSGLTVDTTDTDLYIGQLLEGGIYYLREGFIAFDTSGIPDDAIVMNAVLEVYGSVGTTASWTIQARTFDWSTTVTTADWRTPAQLSALTLLATFATGAAGVNFLAPGWNTFTETADALKDAVNKTGFTRILLVSDRHVNGNTPTGEERALILSGNDVTFPPRLTVTYTQIKTINGQAIRTVKTFNGLPILSVKTINGLA